MTAETMELTNFHLGRKQKQALKERAQAKGTNMAEEIRNAVDAYLAGVTPEELELLDAATNQTASAIAEMSEMLEATNRKADRIFAELEKLRGNRPAGAEPDIVVPTKATGRRASH
jgi:hypothetical protein